MPSCPSEMCFTRGLRFEHGQTETEVTFLATPSSTTAGERLGQVLGRHMSRHVRRGRQECTL